MTDLEMTRLCAKAMGIEYCAPGFFFTETNPPSYNPLHDDAQVTALVKKLRLNIEDHGIEPTKYWAVYTTDYNTDGRGIISHDPSLNRAIVECVAKMQAAL